MSLPDPRAPLSHLRHDLRTPLNQILGYSELLLEESDDAGHLAYAADLEKIRKAAKALLNLINENLTDERLSLVGDIVDLGSRTAAPFAVACPRPPPTPVIPAADPETKNAAAETTTLPCASEASPPSLTAQPGRILVVDDLQGNREVLARQLTRQGHSITTASDGATALERLRAEPFDLVLLDLMMPVLDGFSTLVALKHDPALRHLPVIMISALDELAAVVRCIEHGAEDFLPKPFNATLLQARIGAALNKKRFRDQEAHYLRTIEQTQTRLQAELTEAENYIRSILPPPGLCRTIPVDWRLVPSTELGGDSFGYHWIDEDHFAIYLLDVCGHGVGAALLSVTAINVLRNAALPGVDFRDPGALLTALNEAFLMEKQNDMYFTIWYGVWQVSTRTLRYATAGHPPALLVTALPAGPKLETLKASGMILGGMSGMTYRTFTRTIPGPARLYVVSDGTYEIQRPDGTLWTEAEFHAFFTRPAAPEANELDALFAQVQSLHGPGPLDDDFSIVRFAL